MDHYGHYIKFFVVRRVLCDPMVFFMKTLCSLCSYSNPSFPGISRVFSNFAVLSKRFYMLKISNLILPVLLFASSVSFSQSLGLPTSVSAGSGRMVSSQPDVGAWTDPAL